jgi:hypothetical protein
VNLVRITFSNKSGRVRSHVKKTDREKTLKTAADVVRDLKAGAEKPAGEDYRERSLSLHGLICARCGREFDHSNRHLLTVHHRDGNHHNNPADGSNWENLCVYCHEDAHSREILGDYFDGSGKEKDNPIVYKGENIAPDLGPLGKKLQEAMKRKEQ